MGAGPACKVLVIDDDQHVRDVIVQMLETEGYDVAEASDGSEGLELCARFRPAVAIVDILMPNTEGMETITAMRRSHPEVRILAISGGGQTGYMGFLDFARKLGADATLSKPLRMKELLKIVHALHTGLA